ncbi:hypothetical protein SCLCIDRAFT_287840 [Scleroderma citrinum Foug A]|uniref:Secreted protein n=1 Tax=Scleroderma citrinum Foug A TaxID=1036808 RepID=A0A0C3D4P5_9AGAM|nr:hypothetical protein SCLCIDRAFT_287840 [Scleroderma citrinum Foug A]
MCSVFPLFFFYCYFPFSLSNSSCMFCLYLCWRGHVDLSHNIVGRIISSFHFLSREPCSSAPSFAPYLHCAAADGLVLTNCGKRVASCTPISPYRPYSAGCSSNGSPIVTIACSM